MSLGDDPKKLNMEAKGRYFHTKIDEIRHGGISISFTCMCVTTKKGKDQ